MNTHNPSCEHRFLDISGAIPSVREKSSLDLLQTDKNIFLVLCCKTIDFRSEICQCDQLVDYITTLGENAVSGVGEEGASEVHAQPSLDMVRSQWKKLLKHMDAKADEKAKKASSNFSPPVQIVIFPPMKKQEGLAALFGSMRVALNQRFNPAANNPSWRAILAGDFVTYENMAMEDAINSSLQKELAEVWIPSAPGGIHPLILWLTGGDCELVHAIHYHLNLPFPQSDFFSHWLEELRTEIHTIAMQIMHQNSPSDIALPNRLKRLIDLPESALPKALQPYYHDLFGLLPGSIDPNSPDIRLLRNEQRRKSRYRPIAQLDRDWRGLVMGGFMHPCQAGESLQFRLRSPLLAYGVARFGMKTGFWTCKDPFFRSQVFAKAFQGSSPKEKPSSLDYYLDILLHRGFHGTHPENWLMPPVNHLAEFKTRNKEIDGRWWEWFTPDTIGPSTQETTHG